MRGLLLVWALDDLAVELHGLRKLLLLLLVVLLLLIHLLLHRVLLVRLLVLNVRVVDGSIAGLTALDHLARLAVLFELVRLGQRK